MRENVITDRTIIDVMSFATCAQSIDSDDKTAFIKYAAPFIWEYDYIFYVSPIGVDIEDNGVRETDAEYRELIDLTIKHITKDNWPFHPKTELVKGVLEYDCASLIKDFFKNKR